MTGDGPCFKFIVLTCVSQTEDIDLSGNRYNLLGTIFYIAYILSQ